MTAFDWLQQYSAYDDDSEAATLEHQKQLYIDGLIGVQQLEMRVKAIMLNRLERLTA